MDYVHVPNETGLRPAILISQTPDTANMVEQIVTKVFLREGMSVLY